MLFGSFCHLYKPCYYTMWCMSWTRFAISWNNKVVSVRLDWVLVGPTQSKQSKPQAHQGRCTPRACAHQGATPLGHVSSKCRGQGQKSFKGPAQLAREATTKLQSRQFLIQMDQSGIPSSSLCIPQIKYYLFAPPRQQERRHSKSVRQEVGCFGRVFRPRVFWILLLQIIWSSSDGQARTGLKTSHHILRVLYQSPPPLLCEDYCTHRPEGRRREPRAPQAFPSSALKVFFFFSITVDIWDYFILVSGEQDSG